MIRSSKRRYIFKTHRDRENPVAFCITTAMLYVNRQYSQHDFFMWMDKHYSAYDILFHYTVNNKNLESFLNKKKDEFLIEKIPEFFDDIG